VDDKVALDAGRRHHVGATLRGSAPALTSECFVPPPSTEITLSFSSACVGGLLVFQVEFGLGPYCSHLRVELALAVFVLAYFFVN
jgi:hypothetical protein